MGQVKRNITLWALGWIYRLLILKLVIMVQLILLSDKNMGFDKAVNAPRVTTRRRKKSKKCMAQLVYGDITSTTAISDDSIADDDIEHKNAIIRNEAEVTWEVSQALGIYFDCEKDKLLDVFTDLEYEKRKGNMSRA